MHITEGFLPGIWALVWFVVAIPVISYGALKTARLARNDELNKSHIAVAAAFIFVLSALKIPSVMGSTSHPTGTGIAVVLFGPAVTAFLSAIVLLYQALLLGHGGLTTLGANVVSMGVVGPVAGWVVFRALNPYLDLQKATFAAAVIADWTTYLVTSIQLGVAFPSGPGVAGVVDSVVRFASVFSITQIPIGIVEGAFAAGLIGYIAMSRQSIKTRLGVTA
ncbi:energy-coupling factor ABC transporter permease [Halobacterium salinarum]|uniref:energy-coupling factor ABC transporter permease n=1 Tax=Halobacterium salinarum TaxID=2242 RepID=UPI002553CCDC|nr:energy-coupling factor ABC transporter permease [Halobacterium salinarum]MDL0127887.1 energy-coupling factor ABC transporter permease [Halobacterium salinarum]